MYSNAHVHTINLMIQNNLEQWTIIYNEALSCSLQLSREDGLKVGR